MIQKLKSYLSEIEVNPIDWLLGISAVLMVRFFLEGLSSPTTSPFLAANFSTIIHYYFFFLSFALVFVLFVNKFLPSFQSVKFQFVASSFFLILIAPIVDYVLSGGKGFQMAYLFNLPKELLNNFFLFFGENIYRGITLGLRVEILILLAIFGFLVFKEAKNLLKTIYSAVFLYFVIFVFVSFPSILSFFFQFGSWPDSPENFFGLRVLTSSTIKNNLPSYLEYSSLESILGIGFNFVMAKIWFLVVVFLACLVFIKFFREKFFVIIKNSRPERVAHYLFMIFVGIFASYILYPQTSFNWVDFLSIFVLCLSFYFSWMFAVCTNDKEDIAIDSITNKDRPLVQKTLGEDDGDSAAKLFLIASLVGAYISGFSAFFFVLSFTAIYYIYSIKPTRFKIIPFFSSFLVGLCCLSAVLAGFYLTFPLKDLSFFPPKLAFSIVIIFFLWSHIRDMKDIEGDKLNKIPTVPVIFGDYWGPKVVAILSSLSFLLVPFFLESKILFVLSALAASVNYYFVNKKPYSEKPLFLNYAAFVILGFLVLVF